MYSLMPSACHIWHEIYEVLLLLVPSGFLKLLSFQVASMLLLLTLVYVFHGFQSHAAPLTNLLAESSTNAPREMIITLALRQWSGARHLEKLYKGGHIYPNYPQILDHKFWTLYSGWTKTRDHFI